MSEEKRQFSSSASVASFAPTNDSLLAEIDALNERIKVLKSQLKPTPARIEVSLLDCNKSAKEQRAAKFNENDRVKKAVMMALARPDKAKPTK